MRRIELCMIAAALTCSLTLTSCSNDDSPVGGNPQEETPVQPSQQKRVSQMTTYSLKDGERLLKDVDQCTYDSQGRIKEWKNFGNSTGEQRLEHWAEFSYSDSQIYTVRKLASYSDAPTSVTETYFDMDSEGRIVKRSIYSYREGSPRPEAPQAISTYEYDGQGRMISHTFAYEKKDYDWQDGDMLTVTNYEWQNDNIHTVTVLNEEGAVKSVRTYEPSDITADRVIPVDFNDCEDWLAAYGFFGKTSRFLPASESIKVYAKDKLFTVEDIQFTYVITDGLVTTISQKIENNIILLNKASSTEYETTVEWK